MGGNKHFAGSDSGPCCQQMQAGLLVAELLHGLARVLVAVLQANRCGVHMCHCSYMYSIVCSVDIATLHCANGSIWCMSEIISSFRPPSWPLHAVPNIDSSSNLPSETPHRDQGKVTNARHPDVDDCDYDLTTLICLHCAVVFRPLRVQMDTMCILYLVRQVIAYMHTN